MSSSNPSLGKSLSSSSTHTGSVAAGSTAASFENLRRPTQGPAGPQSLPRKSQGSRRQHKSSRRPDMGSKQVDAYDSMAEMRAVGNASSRRGQTSITHLLSYSAPRPAHDRHHHQRPFGRHPNWRASSGYHAVDKARYVRANYRFVLSPDNSYRELNADADANVDWAHVLQVLASAVSQAASCPICLSEPVAPRMAKCGHIFCLPCLIRFISTSDEDIPNPRGSRCKNCPICEDSVCLQDVRPVRFHLGPESPLPREGDDVVLRLMARNASSTLALPREDMIDATVTSAGSDAPWYFAANVLDYARVMRGTAGYMEQQFSQEIDSLRAQEAEDQLLFGQDGEWSQMAIKAIEAAKEKAMLFTNQTGASDHPTSLPATKSHAGADFYFYSAQPQLYLSPLDIRILKTQFGDFALFPSTILPRVDHVSAGHVVDEALRRRAKYLGHLPFGCIVNFLECDWTDIVAPNVLDSFSSDIERRRKRNRDKAAQEERERIQAERLAMEAIHSSFSGHLTPPRECVPGLESSEFQPLRVPAGAASSPKLDSDPATLALVSLNASSTARTIWGTPLINPDPDPNASKEPNFINDGWLRDEQIHDHEVLGMKLAGGIFEADSSKRLGVQPDSTREASRPVITNNASGGNRGKKKKQKITLMSTGGRRGN